MNTEALLMLAARSGTVPAKEGPVVKNRCRTCKFSRTAYMSGHHIECLKPDPKVTGSPHGINEGWFIYPLNFDPIWMTTECSNYEEQDAPVV